MLNPRNKRARVSYGNSVQSALADTLLRGIGEGRFTIAVACSVARAAVADGVYPQISAVGGLASLGAAGACDRNLERDLQTWLRGTGVDLEPFWFKLSVHDASRLSILAFCKCFAAYMRACWLCYGPYNLRRIGHTLYPSPCFCRTSSSTRCRDIPGRPSRFQPLHDEPLERPCVRVCLFSRLRASGVLEIRFSEHNLVLRISGWKV